MDRTATRLSVEQLRRRGQQLSEQLSREYYLAASGHKPEAELQPIYERYSEILSGESLALATGALRDATPGSEEHRRARLLLEWQVESYAARELAPLDEREIAWENSAIVTMADGTGVPFERAPIDMANARDMAYRRSLEQARAALVDTELAPLRRERFQRERQITERLALAADYNATWELLTGIALGELAGQCERFLTDTRAAWDDTYPEFVRRGLGIEPAEATRGDALALFRAREFDSFFPARDMEVRVQAQVREMGIDPTAAGRIRLDTGERPGKRSRAFCAPVRVPDEVYLVLRPHGGQTDWSTFLHELGHALHFAYMRPDHPFEYRWLGDNSVTESYAMLFDHRMQDAGWLRRYTDISGSRIRDFLRAAGFEELHLLRRYCAKLLYEVELYGGRVRWESLPDLFVERLTGATTFRYSRSEAFVDLDARYYSARYLRAWQLQALLNETLTQRYDADWWRNPRAGPWMVQSMFAEGQRDLADELAMRVSGNALSFAPLIREVEKLLG